MDQQNLNHQAPLMPEEHMPAVEKHIIESREEFFACFLPPHYSILLTVAALLTLGFSLLLSLFSMWSFIDYRPWVFFFHALVSTGLTLWVMLKRDTLAGIVNLACHTAFAAVSFWLVGTVFIYPVIPSVAVLALLVVMNRNWTYYRIRPTAIPPVSARQKRREIALRWTERGLVLLLSCVLVVTSVLPIYDPMLINQKEENFSKGEYIGVTYVNEFMNLRFAPPTGWMMLSKGELLSLAPYYYGTDYDRDVYMLLMCAADVASNAYVEIHTFRQDRVISADEYIKFKAADNYRYKSQYDSLSNERLEPVKLCGRTYEVLRTDYIGVETSMGKMDYEEYMLVRAVGKLTIVIYISPSERDTLEEILACFEAVES